MKFFIGALSLVVILATFGAPAIFVFGWGALTANDRHAITKTIKSVGWLDSEPNRQPRSQGRAGTSG
jgi:hypothetical protein